MNIPIKGDEYYKKLKGGTAIWKGLFFYGEEDYMKTNAKRLLTDTVVGDPTFRDMNLLSFDSLDYSPDALSDAFSSAPVFAEEKLVILTGLDIDGMKESEFSALCNAIDSMNEYEGNVFLLYIGADKLTYSGRKDKTKRFNRLSELLTPVYFEKYTPARLIPWCRMHFSAEGVEAEPEQIKAFISYVSEDMSILDSEIRKLSAYVRANGKNTFTLDDMRLCCASYEEFGVFDLANAILAGDRSQALRIIKKKKEERADPLYVLSEISFVICDLVAIKSMQAAGMPRDEMQSLLRLSDYPMKLRYEAAARFDGELLLRLEEEIVSLDRKLKGQAAKSFSGIETLICLF